MRQLPLPKGAFRFIGDVLAPVRDPFSRDVADIPEATDPEIVELDDGDTFELRAASVRKTIGDETVKMLAYNGSIPGPILRVEQGSEVTVKFTNELELDTTVHWHGLRLENRFDGVPEGAHHGMQPPIPPGGQFTYRLRFPDAGAFWYHPHVREDYTQEHGLYGNIIVTPTQEDFWPPANRDLTLVLDDILIERGRVAPFSQSQSTRTAMGRFGNVMLVNGETEETFTAETGGVVRFYVTNTANVRSFNLGIPEAKMKLVGRDSGRVEHEEFVEEVLISPSERLVLDVLFERQGEFPIRHRTPERSYILGMVTVSDESAEPSFAEEFDTLRRSDALESERERLIADDDFEREPDKTLSLIAEMPGMKHGGGHGHHIEPIEWEDTMELHNRMTHPQNMFWKLVDQETGTVNHDIHWHFETGDRVKVRIVNDPHSDHPMQHPIHVHGERFLVLSRDGVSNENLAWKDTALVRSGETVNILVEMSNPGAWMVHCHIAEHVEGGMMFTFHVEGEDQV